MCKNTDLNSFFHSPSLDIRNRNLPYVGNYAVDIESFESVALALLNNVSIYI